MKNKPVAVGITGGIGCGKSVVSKMLRTMGYKVYDTDSEAKRLMSESDVIKERLVREITEEALMPDGSLNRAAISRKVFSDSVRLAALNEIVHEAVRKDVERWIDSCRDEKLIFMECAIIHQSGLDKYMSAIIEVDAPEELRISRVMKRNGLTREQVIGRMQSQTQEKELSADSVHLMAINDDVTPLLPQIEGIIGYLGGN